MNPSVHLGNNMVKTVVESASAQKNKKKKRGKKKKKAVPSELVQVTTLWSKSDPKICTEIKELEIIRKELL